MRKTDAGVTLLEMLVALSVSALVGIAGLTFLDNLMRVESHASGRLDRLARQDRAFLLLSMDLDAAHQVRLGETLTLEGPDAKIVWRASASGLIRQIARADLPPVTQHLLEDKTAFRAVAPDLLMLELNGLDLFRLFHIRQAPP